MSITFYEKIQYGYCLNFIPKKLFVMKISLISKSPHFNVMVWNYGAQAAGLIVGFVQVKLFTNWLNISEYGLYAEFNATINLLTILFAWNMNHAYIRFGSGADKKNRAEYFWTIIIAQSIILFTGFLLTITLSRLFHFSLSGFKDPVILSLLFSLTLLGLYNTQFKTSSLVSGKHLTFAKINIENLLYSSIGGILFGYLYKDAIGLIIGVISGTFVANIVLYLRQKTELAKPTFNIEKLKIVVNFGLPLLLTSLSYWFIVSGNRLLISNFLGLSVLGQFSVLMTIPGMITVVYSSLSSIFFSSLSSLYAQNRFDEINGWIKTIYELYAVLSMALCCAGFIASEQIISLIASDKYLFEGLKWIFLTGGLNSVLHGLLSISLRQYDLEVRPWNSMINSIIVMATSIITSVILLPLLGMIGCLIGNILSFIIGILIIKNHKFNNLKIVTNDVKIVVFILLSLALTVFIDSIPYTDLIIRLLFALTIFILIVLLSIPFKLLNVRKLTNNHD